MSIGHSLLIKYGLRNSPSDSQVADWARLVRKYEQKGYSREDAGRAAAKDLFSDFGTMKYASEADTIESLLRAAEQK